MIAITGTSGFVGKSLTNKLNKDYIPLTFNQNRWKIKESNLKQHSDISKFNLTKVETLIHLGSFVPKKSDKVNLWNENLNSILSTHKLLSLDLPNLKTIIYISSSRAADWDPIKSTKMKKKARTIYGAAKYISENLIQNHASSKSIDYVVIRPDSLYGPGENQFTRLIPNLIRSALANEPLYISDNKNIKLTFVYIGDLVKLILLVASGNFQKNLIEISGSEHFTLTEIANKILRIAKSNSTILYYSDPRGSSKEEAQEDEIGFECFKLTSFEDGLKFEINSFA